MLPKAVFLLYLKHPEGIRFCDLPDYREELYHIYASFSGRDDANDIRASIDDVTNPLSNSINEKCSRIRHAFLSKFEEKLARNYYITGDRGTAKKIILPRELVTWEEWFDPFFLGWFFASLAGILKTLQVGLTLHRERHSLTINCNKNELFNERFAHRSTSDVQECFRTKEGIHYPV